MKKFLFSSLLFVLAGMILGCAQQMADPDEMIAEAKALDQRFLAAYNNLDVDGVMACYWNSPELVSFPPDAMQEKGWEAVKQGMQRFFDGVPGVKLELLEMNYKVLGDAVFGWGTWRISIPGGDGQSIEMEGRYSDVKARRDGKWVYIQDHASVPLPPPPDGSPE